MGTKPSVFVDGDQSTLVMASYLNDLRTLCYELAGNGTNAPATVAAVRSNLGFTAVGDAVATAVTAAAARGTLGATDTGEALFTAASAAAARSSLGLVIGTDVAAFAATATQAEMRTGSLSSVRAMSPLSIRQAALYSTTQANSVGGTSILSVTVPAEVKRIEILLNSLSTNGTDPIDCTFHSSDHLTSDSSSCSFTAAAVATTTLGATSRLQAIPVVAAASAYNGIIELYTRADENYWIYKSQFARESTAHMFVSTGQVIFTGNSATRTLTVSTRATNTFDVGVATCNMFMF